MIVYGADGVKTAVSPDGSGSVYDANGRRVSASSISAQSYNFDNAPAAPSAYDDEFDASSLNARWTASSSGTTNPMTAGTVNPISSLTTPVYDLATQTGILLVQSDNSTLGINTFSQNLTPAANATYFFKILGNLSNISGADELDVYMTLRNSGDANEWVYLMLRASGSAYALRLNVTNNGVATSINGGSIAELGTSGDFYLILWKNSDVYHGGYATANRGGITYIGSVTKTGVTSFDRLTLDFNTANETPSRIVGVDFFRYYPTITYALMNSSV